jgi:anti-sigma-K factor RskA
LTRKTEKNTNMQNVDELCIKYVLNELDPSERLMVEQAMRDDENVLIEIESLRCTLRKLDQLPQVSPPNTVSARVLEIASQHVKEKKRIWPMRMAWGGLAAAAILLVAFGTGIFSQSGSEVQQAGFTADVVPVESMASPAPLQAAANTNRMPSTPVPQVSPWVDRQNVFHINIR